MKGWSAFSKSRAVRIICFAAAAALLVASVVGLWHSSSASSEGGTPGASYEHKGQFDYMVYLKPNTLYGSAILPENSEETEEEETPLVFFRDIIDETQLAFSYKFDCSEPLAKVTNDVVVTITAENPGMWQKEITVLEETHRGKDFRVDFPLLLDSLENVVDEIEEDIGITSSQRDFIIRAAVHTTAEIASGRTIKDDFSHEITAILKTKTLELQGALKGSDASRKEGISYKEEGRFDYEVYLKSNKLYGVTVLRSEGVPVPEPPPSRPSPAQTLGPGLVYFPRIIDNIKVSFSYQFSCDSPVNQQSEEVEVTAIIENPDNWSKSLVLVPKTGKIGDFTLSFPVDIHYFNEVIDAIGRETGAGGGSYNLNIKADVHTFASTDLGTVDEGYTQTLEGTLKGNTLTFGKELSQSKSGSIGGTTAHTGSEKGGLKTPWLGGLVIAVLALCYLGWNQTQLKPAISEVDAEAARARKKYRQVIVDIEELPEAKPNEIIVPLSSLDDLVRIADDLVKPVLHQVREGGHIYCTIDGSVRYRYINRP
jgi:hypothetical protein